MNKKAKEMTDAQLTKILSTSLYIGLSDNDIMKVIDYCKAANLDPMLKPVHVVPMKIDTGRKDTKGWAIKEERRIVMPGIGQYRTQASQTKMYAGITEPHYGSIIETKLGKVDMKFPCACTITVKRLLPDGSIGEFTAKEVWLENYASKGYNDPTPNSMWQKRPYGQLAKCTEAQALRKAFPELGVQPTAEEMAGKELEPEQEEVITVVEQPTAKEETIDKATGEITAALEKHGIEVPPATEEEADATTPVPLSLKERITNSKTLTELNPLAQEVTNMDEGLNKELIQKLGEDKYKELKKVGKL